MDSITFFDDSCDGAKADALREKLTGVNDQALAATQNMIDFWTAVGGPEAEAAILKLQRTQAELKTVGEVSVTSGKQINDFIADGGAQAFDAFSKSVVETGNASRWPETPLLQFASDFLREIAQMIIKQAILNALGAGTSGGGGAGGIIAGLVNGLFRHHGGVVGSGGGMRSVPLAAFLGAQRFHEGGLPGLKPGEVGAVLKKGEEVITEDDPRHVGNGGAAAGGHTRIVNAVDGASFLEQALRSRAGEKVILNFIRANPSAVRGAMGSRLMSLDLWSHPVNWQSPVEEEILFRTEIITSRDGSEQRIAQRVNPRLAYRWQAMARQTALDALERRLGADLGRELVFAHPRSRTALAADAAAGATVINVGTPPDWLAVGQKAVLIRDDGRAETVTVASGSAVHRDLGAHPRLRRR